jgi:hypothetical protein
MCYYQLVGCYEEEIEPYAPGFHFGAKSIFRQLAKCEAARCTVAGNIFRGAPSSNNDVDS